MSEHVLGSYNSHLSAKSEASKLKHLHFPTRTVNMHIRRATWGTLFLPWRWATALLFVRDVTESHFTSRVHCQWPHNSSCLSSHSLCYGNSTRRKISSRFWLLPLSDWKMASGLPMCSAGNPEASRETNVNKHTDTKESLGLSKIWVRILFGVILMSLESLLSQWHPGLKSNTS